LFVQIFAIPAIFLSTYYPGLDICFSCLYLLVIGIEANRTRNKPQKYKILIPLIWQGPGLVLSIISLMDLNSYSLFILQFWHTPVIPLLSLWQKPLSTLKPLYYYLLLIMSLFLGAFYYIFAAKIFTNNENPPVVSNIENQPADNNVETFTSGSCRNR